MESFFILLLCLAVMFCAYQIESAIRSAKWAIREDLREISRALSKIEASLRR